MPHRAMLKDSNMHEHWWGQAIETAAYLRNHSLTRSNPDLKTPHERFTGKIPDLSNICTFGCKVFTYVNNPRMGKLDPRCDRGYTSWLWKEHKRMDCVPFQVQEDNNFTECEILRKTS